VQRSAPCSFNVCGGRTETSWTNGSAYRGLEGPGEESGGHFEREKRKEGRVGGGVVVVERQKPKGLCLIGRRASPFV
jgi:hypothetical protein